MFASVYGIGSGYKASQMALQACKRKSGRSCTLLFVYANQCASITTGRVAKSLRLFYDFSTQSGQAMLNAMEKCNAANGKDCALVVAEECSRPIY
ncbi:DUF4189 domain-containing protein [Neisseria sp. WLZKY-1]|uniref:DUF4189 domain-containing protein n=1 Tax=Neisseria sp. WLZKY-1 TaxID=3390377 RepID=UPI00397C1992